MAIVDTIATALIAVSSGAIGAYVTSFLIIRKVKNGAVDMVLNFIEDISAEFPKLLAKPEVQQFVYSIGVLVGNGAKSGVGLSTKTGKFKFEDLIGMAIGQLLPKILPGAGEQAATTTVPAW
jgi:hypothetical protein